MSVEYIYIDVIAPSFILLPIICACLRWRFLPAAGKVLLFYLILDGSVSLSSTLLVYYHHTNLPLYHFATIVETVLLFYFFSLSFADKRYIKLTRWLMWVFPMLGILNSLFIQSIFQFNSYALSLQSLLVIALCFVYWWQHQDHLERTWGSFPLNWIISGLLIYFSSVFVLFTFSDFIISLASKKISFILWNIHASLSVIMYVLMTIGIRKFRLHDR
jgi:hypothetical protein